MVNPVYYPSAMAYHKGEYEAELDEIIAEVLPNDHHVNRWKATE